VGTGVDVSMNPVVLNDIEVSTLVLTAVADNDMRLLSTCVDGVGVAVLVILEAADDVNTFVVAALVAEDDVLLLEAAAEADVEVLVPPQVPQVCKFSVRLHCLILTTTSCSIQLEQKCCWVQTE